MEKNKTITVKGTEITVYHIEIMMSEFQTNVRSEYAQFVDDPCSFLAVT